MPLHCPYGVQWLSIYTTRFHVNLRVEEHHSRNYPMYVGVQLFGHFFFPAYIALF